MLFAHFGHFENFINVIGEDSGEVGACVPGHVCAQRRFPGVLRILNVPDLRHAAARPERTHREEEEYTVTPE